MARWKRIIKSILVKVKNIKIFNFGGPGAEFPYLGILGPKHVFLSCYLRRISNATFNLKARNIVSVTNDSINSNSNKRHSDHKHSSVAKKVKKLSSM